MQLSTDAIKTTTRGARGVRSPTLNHFRLSPFRVLRVKIDVGAEEAQWKAEELVNLTRAGLPAPADPLPWLPGVEEFEVHQIVQVIEDPFRRLAAQMLYFDLVHDVEADQLTRLLAELPHGGESRYLSLASELESPLAPSPTVDAPVIRTVVPAVQSSHSHIITCPARQTPALATPDEACPSCQANIPNGHQPPSNTVERAPASPEPPLVEMARLEAASQDQMRRVALAINQANLRLLLAARALSLPDFPAGAVENSMQLDWHTENGMQVIANCHDGVVSPASDGLQASRLGELWSSAISGWKRLLASLDFQAYVARTILDLKDDLATEDDAEIVIGAVRSQITDLVVGEVKLQIIDGRHDRVAALLAAVSASGMNPREWGIALRPLRQLFETEVRELDALIKDESGLPARDFQVYITRLGTLARRWKAIDGQQLLGLSHIVDERVRWAFGSIKRRVDFSTVEDLKPLLSQVVELAAANSLKQQIQSYIATSAQSLDWACFFCKVRESELERAVVLNGKKETHRTHSGNTTTIHYAIKSGLVTRCDRCSKLHEFLSSAELTIWMVLLPALVQVQYLFWNTLKEGEWFVYAAAGLLVYGVVGAVTGTMVVKSLTPLGELPNYKYTDSRSCKDLRAEGFGVSPNFARNALTTLRNS